MFRARILACFACVALMGMVASCGTSHSGPTLTGIDISPISPTIGVNDTQQFTATGTYTDGSTQDLTSSVAWSSSDSTAASISTTGLATALLTGTSTITATDNGVLGKIAVLAKEPENQ